MEYRNGHRSVDRFWFRSAIAADGRLATAVAILTRVPLHPAADKYDKAQATLLIEAISAYKDAHKIDVIEILRRTAG